MGRLGGAKSRSRSSRAPCEALLASVRRWMLPVLEPPFSAEGCASAHRCSVAWYVGALVAQPMRALARDCVRDFCRAACRYAASFTVTVKGGSSHSSGRREHIGQAILRQGALLVVSPAAVLAEPALQHAHSGTHLPRLLTSFTPIATCNVLAVVLADTNLISATAGVTETVLGERMGAANPPLPMPVAERVLLARVTGPFARCPSSRCTIHGAIESPHSRCTQGCAARGACRA